MTNRGAYDLNKNRQFVNNIKMGSTLPEHKKTLLGKVSPNQKAALLPYQQITVP